MEILRVTKIGNRMNNLENFHVFNVRRLDNQINGKDTVKHNVIFHIKSEKLVQRAYPTVNSSL